MSGYTSRLEELRDNNCDCPCRRDVETWAADRIESLTSENTRLRMEWVSVEDDLPDEYQPVIAYFSDGSMGEAWIGYEKTWKCPGGTDYLTKPTHWIDFRSLPAPEDK